MVYHHMLRLLLAMRVRTTAAGLLLLLLGCGSTTAPASNAVTVTDPAAILRNLVIDGDPTSQTGARWTYRETAADGTYDLAGVLLKPSGNGPFPGVIVSHG